MRSPWKLGLLFLILMLVAAFIVTGGVKQDYRACKAACRAARAACEEHCEVVCDHDADCIHACGDKVGGRYDKHVGLCQDEKDRCVDRCRAIRDGESPDEP